MKCGLLSDSSTTRNGFGWNLTAIPERLSGCMLGVAIVPVLRHYGNHCHQSTINAPFVTLIFGLHMSRFFPSSALSGEVEIDKSYFGARRVRGKSGAEQAVKRSSSESWNATGKCQSDYALFRARFAGLENRRAEWCKPRDD